MDFARPSGVALRHPIADTGFNSNSILADLNECGVRIVIQHDPRRGLAAAIWKRHLI
ncbi:hypothetical protein ACVDG8_013415 [Mesorhizobium sp. ORM8.1]